MDKATQKIIARGYSNAGEEFLAAKLKKIFSFIETPADMAIHNDMLRDVIAMVGNDAPQMRKGIARTLMGKVKGFGDLVKQIARIILNIGAKNAKA